MYPYQNQYQPQYRQDNALIRVTGLEGAKAYQMGPNSTIALFDGSEDLMYIKSTDGAGFPTIRVFKFEEVIEQASKMNTNDYMTRQEVKEYVEQLISTNAKPTKSDNKSAKSGSE